MMPGLDWISADRAVGLFALVVAAHAFAALMVARIRRRPGSMGRPIYDMAPRRGQLRKELVGSLQAPSHALVLAVLVSTGWLQLAPDTLLSVVGTFALAVVLAEVWHYASHRAMHTKWLLFIHRHHHESRVMSVWSAMSFSMLEKLLYSAGLIGLLGLASWWLPVSFWGVVTYYLFYLATNTIGHSNLEMRDAGFCQTRQGQILNTATYHALHHGRYVGNYGLLTQVLDRMFGTRWEDYDLVHARVASGRPLGRLGERVQA